MTETLDDVLEHFGVKGMHWGVRKASDNEGSSGGSSGPSKRSVKKAAKADKKWEKNTYSTKGQIAVHNEMARNVNPKIEAYNNSPKWKDLDVNKNPGSKQTQDYLNGINRMVEQEYGKAVEKTFGKSPSGNLKATYNHDTQQIEIKRTDVKHADDPNLSFTVVIKNGLIVKLEPVSTELQQSDLDEFEDVLVHFGVKGMRWGVRRRRTDSGPGSADAEKAKQHATTVKAHGTKALSNKELQELVTRMNLEQQFSTLHQKSKKENPAAKFAKDLLVNIGKEQAAKLARDQIAKQLAKKLASA